MNSGFEFTVLSDFDTLLPDGAFPHGTMMDMRYYGSLYWAFYPPRSRFLDLAQIDLSLGGSQRFHFSRIRWRDIHFSNIITSAHFCTESKTLELKLREKL